jgi:hypothetical protein
MVVAVVLGRLVAPLPEAHCTQKLTKKQVNDVKSRKNIVIYTIIRGCIDKILRINISPKIKCKVWIIDMSMLSIYHLVSYSKKYPYHIYVGTQTRKLPIPVLRRSSLTQSL